MFYGAISTDLLNAILKTLLPKINMCDLDCRELAADFLADTLKHEARTQATPDLVHEAQRAGYSAADTDAGRESSEASIS